MPLAVITPTRRRWNPWMREQARRLSEQMEDVDRWVIVCDNDQPSPDDMEILAAHVGEHRLIMVHVAYNRPRPPTACVNRMRNTGAAIAPPGYDLVEMDDHDLIEPTALADIREAFAGGADYVFANIKRDALIVDPLGGVLLEGWPILEHGYKTCAFREGHIDAIGLRAVKRQLWDFLGGWRLDVWPCADKDFAVRAEHHQARIVCLDRPLCTVLVNDPSSLSYLYRGAAPEGQPPDGEQPVTVAAGEVSA